MMLSGGKLCRGLRSQTTFSCAHGPSLFSLRSCLAGLPAEEHAPMVIADKTKLSTTVCTAIFQLGHGVILQIEDTIRTTVRREKSNIVARLLSTPSALRTCGPTQRRVGRHIGETHCRKLPPN